MGCNSSKPAVESTPPKSVESATPVPANTISKLTNSASAILKRSVSKRDSNDEVYLMLNAASKKESLLPEFWSDVKSILEADARAAAYIHPTTHRTPLHLACSMLDMDDGTSEELAISSINTGGVVAFIQAIIRDAPECVAMKDSKGNIPLHYVISRRGFEQPNRLKVRAHVLRALVTADFETAKDYFSSNAIVYDKETGGVTPLYHVLQTLPDDCEIEGTTVAYVSAVQEIYPPIVSISNAADGDKPLALLYRRFTRQFDLSEKFFTGDNSREEVVSHRRRYKVAAGNTWKIIELLLRPAGGGGGRWRLVHRAIQVETPPDLLRYIVETNAEELTQADDAGNLPIHYAAKSIPQESSFPAFYSKYIVDELLYKFPEAAGIPDGDGKYPLDLAVQSGKQWIGGGVKSLYDAYPEALGQIDLDVHSGLRQALSFGGEEREKENDDTETEENASLTKGIIQDEHHDAIMLVQQDDVAIFEVVSAMWAHEEDAGVQMLGCVAIGRHIDAMKTDTERLRIALSTVATVVNAMKAHPNEPVVQEKACSVLKKLACADGYREVSFVAAGAIAAIVGAMQAHVGDATVQEETCGAIAEIVRRGGSERATIVGSVSGITAMLNALGTHPESVGVQAEACRALKNVTDFPNANLPDLPRAQVEPLLEIAMQTCPACKENADILMSRVS